MSAEKTPGNEPNDPNLASMLHEDKLAPGTKPKKKRRWLKVLGVIVVLIVALVFCAPYIASFGFIRSIIVSKINSNLRGSVKLDDYSLGWLSGVSAQNLQVFDADNKLVISIPHVSTELSLIGAMRGNFDLGDTRIDVKLDNIVIDQNGNTNLDSIVKSESAKASHASEHKQTSQQTSDVIELPGVRGKITINLVGGTISGPGLAAPITIDPSSSIVLDIADINQPIKDTIKLAYRMGDSPLTTISASGSVDAVQGNKIDPKTIDLKLKADQKLAIDHLDVSAINPIVRARVGPDGEIGGVAGGTLDVSAEGVAGISASGEFQVADALFTGGAIKDRLVLDKVSIPIQITRTAISANQTQIKIEKLGVNTPLANLSVSGEVQEEAINNLLGRKAPEGTGKIEIAASVPDFGKVARALPKTIDLQKGVEIKSGSLTSTQQIVIARDRVSSNQKLDLVAAGTKDGSPIKLNPVHLETAVSVLPRENKPPSFRDLKLAMTSSFLTLDGGGDSLAAVQANGKIDLNQLYTELTQFKDLGDLHFSGNGDIAFSSKAAGDPTDPLVPIDTLLKVNLNNVRLATGASDQSVDQQKLTIAAGGKVLRDPSNVPVMFDNGTLTFQAGESGAPVIDVAASAKVDLKNGSVPTFDLSKCAVSDLHRAQEQFGALLPMLKAKQLEIASGGFSAQVAGKFDGQTVALDSSKPLGFSVTNLVLNKAGQPVLNREDIAGKIAGTFSLGKALGAHLTDLAITSKSDLFALKKSGEGPIDLEMGAGVKGNGAIEISADLKRLYDIISAPTSDSANHPVGQLSSGSFNGTLKLYPGNQNSTAITFDGKATNLSVTTTGKPLSNETVAIVLRASSPPDQSGIDIAEASLASRFATAKVSDGSINLNGGTWDLVRSAKVDVDVPDLAAVWTLKNAFMPAAPVADASQFVSPQEALVGLLLAPPKRKAKAVATPANESTAPLGPLQITRGSAKMQLDISRDEANQTTRVDLSAANISNLELSREGTKPFQFSKDISLVMNSAISAAQSQPVSKLKISALAGDLGGIAKLSMAQPINVSGLSDLKTLSADGSIKLEGAIEAATPLLAFFNGSLPLPYSGDYVATQTISTRAGNDQNGPLVSLTGDLVASNFNVKNGDKSVFAEKQINLRNNIDAYPKTKSAIVRQLTLDMPQTQALAIKFSGRIIDWDQNRAIRGDNSDAATLDLGYDLEKLWPIIKPTLSADTQDSLKDLKLEGKFDRSFAVSGKFPKRDTWQQSISYLNAKGGFAVQLVDAMGANVQNFDYLVEIDKGVLTTKNKDKPATCNGGTLDLSEITVDLTKPDPRISIAKNHKLLDKVTINPLLGDSLGKFINPMFANNKRAQGLVNVTMNYCDNLALGDKLKTSDSGKAEIAMSITDMDIANPLGSLMFGKILAAVPMLGGNNLSESQADSFKGELKNAVATIDAGDTKTSGTFSLIDPTTAVQNGGAQIAPPKPMLMTFDGNIHLSDLKQSINVSVPPEFVAILIPDRKVGETLIKIFPGGIPIVLKGTSDHPQVDVGDIGKKFIEGQIKSGGIGNIGDILGGGKKKKGK